MNINEERFLSKKEYNNIQKQRYKFNKNKNKNTNIKPHEEKTI